LVLAGVGRKKLRLKLASEKTDGRVYRIAGEAIEPDTGAAQPTGFASSGFLPALLFLISSGVSTQHEGETERRNDADLAAKIKIMIGRSCA
jgi:hypothetical protein